MCEYRSVIIEQAFSLISCRHKKTRRPDTGGGFQLLRDVD